MMKAFLRFGSYIKRLDNLEQQSITMEKNNNNNKPCLYQTILMDLRKATCSLDEEDRFSTIHLKVVLPIKNRKKWP